jgi:hypothetical protein
MQISQFRNVFKSGILRRTRHVVLGEWGDKVRVHSFWGETFWKVSTLKIKKE